MSHAAPGRLVRMAVVLALVATGALAAVVGGASGARADDYSARLRTAVGDLRVAREVRAGYDRDLFPHWVDADGDGCDTRREVLIAEADDPVRVGSGCRLSGGRWFSYYDRVSWSDSSRIDIDHMVPLAEAWDSGARRWSTSTRRRFANDLGERRSLVGVTDSVNQSKGDRDPREWMPRYDRCRYLRDWVAVKHRWRLRVDRGEKRAIRRQVRRLDCANTRIRVTRAR